MEPYRIFFASIKQTLQTNQPDPQNNISDEILVIWELKVDNLELLAGMLAAAMGIMDDLNAESDLIYYVDSNADVSSFRLVDNLSEQYLRTSSVNKLKDGEIGIWLKGSERFVYSLYRFNTNAFFQGIISICNSFNVDFRNYIYGFPFDKYGNQYSLGDYVMAPYQVGIDAPDIDDIEEEEEDDENINEPLARTDDIITFRDENTWND